MTPTSSLRDTRPLPRWVVLVWWFAALMFVSKRRPSSTSVLTWLPSTSSWGNSRKTTKVSSSIQTLFNRLNHYFISFLLHEASLPPYTAGNQYFNAVTVTITGGVSILDNNDIAIPAKATFIIKNSDSPVQLLTHTHLPLYHPMVQTLLLLLTSSPHKYSLLLWRSLIHSLLGRPRRCPRRCHAAPPDSQPRQKGHQLCPLSQHRLDFDVVPFLQCKRVRYSYLSSYLPLNYLLSSINTSFNDINHSLFIPFTNSLANWSPSRQRGLPSARPVRRALASSRYGTLTSGQRKCSHRSATALQWRMFTAQVSPSVPLTDWHSIPIYTL